MEHSTIKLLFLLIPVIASEEQVISPWELKGCDTSSNNLPFSQHTPYILNLKRLTQAAPESWLMFYGTLFKMNEVGLRSGELYKVTKKADEQYTFSVDNVDKTYKIDHMQLDQSSYGFVSCHEDEETARAESNKWWKRIPTPTWLIIMISVGVLVLLVVIIATTIGIVIRRRSRRNANLFPLSKRVVMRPRRGDSIYA